MTGDQVRAGACSAGAVKSTRNPGQPPLNIERPPQQQQAAAAAAVSPMMSSTPNSPSLIQNQTIQDLARNISSPPSQRKPYSEVVMPAASHPPPGQQSRSDEQIGLYQSVRESTLNIRLKQYQNFDGNKLFNWIESLGLNPMEFKPRAAGMVNRNNDYQVTFLNKETALKVMAKSGSDCVVNGVVVGTINLTDCNIVYMRVRWLDAWIDNGSIKDALEHALQTDVHPRSKVRSVKNMTEDTPWGKIDTNIRNVVVELPMDADPNLTPATISVWQEKEYKGLITVKGLAQKCLKCNRRGHISSECEYPCRRCDLTDKQYNKDTPDKWTHKEAEHEEWNTARVARITEKQKAYQDSYNDKYEKEKKQEEMDRKLAEELNQKEKEKSESGEKDKAERDTPKDLTQKHGMTEQKSDESMDEDDGNLVIDLDAANNSFNSNISQIDETQMSEPRENNSKRFKIS